MDRPKVHVTHHESPKVSSSGHPGKSIRMAQAESGASWEIPTVQHLCDSEMVSFYLIPFSGLLLDGGIP